MAKKPSLSAISATLGSSVASALPRSLRMPVSAWPAFICGKLARRGHGMQT